MAEVEKFTPILEVEFPYPKPRPAEHQRLHKEPTGDLYLLLRRPAVEECFCIEHGPSLELAYMRYIYKKDEKNYDLLQRTRKIMAARANCILDHYCPDIDAKMDELYTLDYSKRGLDINNYKPLSRAKDCKIGTPIRPPKIGLEDCFLNTELYPHLPQVRPIVDPPRPLQYGLTPQTMPAFFPPYARGLTEYENAYSATGMAKFRHARYYLEPQPTSRLRADDFHA